MKSTWFGDKKRYEFAKTIREADPNEDMYTLFRKFLTCVFLSFRQATYKLRTGELNDEWEQQVIKEQQSVKNHVKFSEALGILTMALDKKLTVDGPYDFLGQYLSEMEQVDSKFRGQLFTPTHLAQAMCQMTIQDLKPQQVRTLWLNEPACGGGAMVIGASTQLESQGFFPWDYHWVAVDVDWKCFAMAYIQLTLLGIPATVIHGNALTLETFDSATTLVGVLHPPKNLSYETQEKIKKGKLEPGQKIRNWVLVKPMKTKKWICQCNCGHKQSLYIKQIHKGTPCNKCKES